MLIPLVLKWAYMVSVSKFKCCIAKTNVCLLWGWCRDLGLVDHVPVVAFSVHGAHAWVLAVAIAVIGGIRFVDLGFVVVGYNGFDICHAAIAQFKRVPVKILWRGFDLGKCWSRERKHSPTFVLTFLLKGGLYQRMFLGWFFRDSCFSLRDSL